jgi:hypothetical protein
MKEIYLVWFTCDDKRLSAEAEILIGVYSSFEKAVDARNRFEQLNGFKDYKDGFEIIPQIIDEDRWKAGFTIS